MTTVIVRVAARVLTPLMFLFTFYLLVRGHNGPGGGFIAATVGGLAVVFRAYAFGAEGIERLLRLGVDRLIGAGLLVAIGTGIAGWVWGDGFLATASITWHPPLIGEIELSSALLFEVGVYMTVLSVTLAVISELGSVDE